MRDEVESPGCTRAVCLQGVSQLTFAVLSDPERLWYPWDLRSKGPKDNQGIVKERRECPSGPRLSATETSDTRKPWETQQANLDIVCSGKSPFTHKFSDLLGRTCTAYLQVFYPKQGNPQQKAPLCQVQYLKDPVLVSSETETTTLLMRFIESVKHKSNSSNVWVSGAQVPLWKYLAISLSNVAATWCQYEAQDFGSRWRSADSACFGVAVSSLQLESLLQILSVLLEYEIIIYFFHTMLQLCCALGLLAQGVCDWCLESEGRTWGDSKAEGCRLEATMSRSMLYIWLMLLLICSLTTCNLSHHVSKA